MLEQIVGTESRSWQGWMPLPADDDVPPAPFQELAWRRPPQPVRGADAEILTSRWQDASSGSRRAQAVAPADRYVVGISLRPARLRLTRGSQTLSEGMMPQGMVTVTGPAQVLQAEFQGPCDFIHLYVAADRLHDCQAACGEAPARDLGDLMVRDQLAAELGRTLTEGSNAGNPRYADSIGQTILMRLLALRPSQARVSPLPKWRLRRVQEHVALNIAERITLEELATRAGLSRMHFAAQFRAATGCSPHEYVLQQRIEYAKSALAEGRTSLVQVALGAGFQTQSHFSTVFKRLTGETPGRWQQLSLNAAQARPAAARVAGRRDRGLGRFV